MHTEFIHSRYKKRVNNKVIDSNFFLLNQRLSDSIHFNEIMLKFTGLIIFILFLPAGASFADTFLTLGDLENDVELSPYLYILRDSSSLTFEEVSADRENNNFTHNKGIYPAFGFTDDIIWGRVSVQDSSSEQRRWFIMFDYPLLDDVAVYTASKNGNYKKINIVKNSSGQSSRIINHRKIIIPLLFENEINTIYFRIKTEETVELPVRILDSAALSRRNYIEMFISGMYYGIICVMLLYNLFIYLTLRDKSYLYYILYLVSVILGQLGLDGYLYEFFNNDILDKGIRVVAGSTGITSVLFFTIYYLNIKEESKKLYRLVKYLIPVANLPVLLFVIFGFHVAIQLTLILFVMSALFFLSIGAMKAMSNPAARYYLLAWVFMLGGVIVFGLKSANIFIPYVTTFSLHVGSAMEVTILSFALGYRIRRLQNEKDNVTEVFGKAVAPEIRDLLLNGNIKLGGDDKKATILFSDIRNFTVLSEKYSPEKIVSILNRHFELVSRIVHEEKGLVNKYIGDSALALFNIPLSIENHCDRALNSAIAIVEASRDLNKKFEMEGLPGLKLGIGIHTGDVLAGNIGSSSRMEYTVIGDTVNTASRIEQLTKAYRTPVLTTETVIHCLVNPGSYLIREIDLVRLKGKENHVRVFEVFNADEESLRMRKKESLPRYNEARELFLSRKFTDSLILFEELVSEMPEDHVVKIMADRCRKLAETSPGENWTGSVFVSSK